MPKPPDSVPAEGFKQRGSVRDPSEGNVRNRHRLVAIAIPVLALICLSAAIAVVRTSGAPIAPVSAFPSGTKPQSLTDPDAQSVELGVRFTVSTPGAVTGIRFYRTGSNVGPHIGTLWGPNKKALARVSFTTTRTGWVGANFSSAVRIEPGRTYVASYLAPKGHYSADQHYFNKAVTANHITLPKGAGVYAYGQRSLYPQLNYHNSNYYVDVLFVPGAATGSSKATAPSAVPEPRGSATSANQASTGTPGLHLSALPWYGGPSYYAKFPNAAASGWTSTSFFPIAVFLGKPAHAPSLSAAGVNTYMGAEHDGSPITEITDQGISVIAQTEWTPAEVGNDRRVVGWLLSDECEMGSGDCTANTEAGRLAQQRKYAVTARSYHDGRFLHANFGNGVLGTYWAPTTMDDHLDLVDESSVDKYAYTSPAVQDLLRNSPSWPKGKSPSSAGAYGWLEDRMEGFMTPTASKPNWVFVETAMPYLTEAGAETISAEQISGAAWNAIIHGASGIAYFQHNNNGRCGNYSIVECPDARKAVTAVDTEVRSLAPVLNTPSYRWTFGSGIETALKTYHGSAYIFAMTDGGTGSRNFKLPSGIKGTTVDVVGEGRSLPVTSGSFTDNFSRESTHHIYRLALG